MAYPTTSEFRDPLSVDDGAFYYPPSLWQGPEEPHFDSFALGHPWSAFPHQGAAVPAYPHPPSGNLGTQLPTGVPPGAGGPDLGYLLQPVAPSDFKEFKSAGNGFLVPTAAAPSALPPAPPIDEGPRHAGPRLFSCGRCGKQYCRKSTLKAHVKHHLGERSFVCQICGKTFSQAANLTAHRRVHTGEKPFSCSICLRPFSQSSSLVTHKRTHTGERPYPCSHCDKAFTDSSTLTKHMRTHTGQKPYACRLCLMRFSQSGNLHRHYKTHRAADGKP